MGADHVFTIMKVPWGAEAGRKEAKCRVRQTDGCSMKKDRETERPFLAYARFSHFHLWQIRKLEPVYSF